MAEGNVSTGRWKPSIATRALLFGALYFLSAHLGSWLSVKTNLFTTFWPPGGLYLGILLCAPLRQWPWFIAAAIAGNIGFELSTSKTPLIALLFSLGNTLEAAFGAWAIRTFLNAIPSIRRVRDLVALAVLGAMLSTVLSASIGTATLHFVAGATEWPLRIWLRWWTSNALSVLLFAPLAITALTAPSSLSPKKMFPAVSPRMAMEKIGWLILFLCTLWLVFLEKPNEVVSFNYLLWPLMIWAGLRFRMTSILLINLGIALVGAWTLSQGEFLFSVSQMLPSYPTISLHFFLIVLVSSSLIIGAISTERNTHQSALKASERQLRDMFDHTIDGILVADPATGRFVQANRAICAMTGYSEAEFRAMGLADLHPEDAIDHVRRKFIGAADGSDPLSTDTPVQRKDGSIFHVDINASPVSLEGRQLLLGVFRDVSERRRSQEALRESEERYRELFDNINNGVAVYEVIDGGKDFIFKDFNRAAEKIDKDSRERLIGKSIFEVRPGVERFGLIDVFRKVHQTGKPARHPVNLYQDDRLMSWYENYVYKLPSGEIVAVFEDITDRKKAEENLRLKTEELDRYFTSSLDLLCIADTNGYFRRLNPQWKETLGYEIAELEKIKFLDLVHPDDLASTIDAIAALSNQHTVLNFTNRYRHNDGSWRWIEWRSIPHGEIIYATARDVTDRRETEIALRRSERLLKQSQQVAGLGHYVFDTASGTWTCSEELERIFGIAPGFSKTMEGWLSIIHPDDRDMMRRHLLNHVLGERNKFDRQYRIIRPSDGAIRWMHGLGNLEFDAVGNPVKMFGTIQDITERRRAEESLVESERRYRSIVENVNDAFYIHDFDGNILDCNDNACKMLGYARDELIGASLNKFDSGKESHLMPARMKKLMIDGTVVFEGEHIRKDGSPVAVNVSARIVSRQGNGIVQSFVRDISDRKLADENMMKAQKLESLGMLAGGIAHDFNNLLAGIFGNIDLALEEAQHGRSKTAANFLGKSMTVFERARDLTRQLLTFSKGGAPAKKQGDIGLTVRDTVLFALSGSNVRSDIDCWPETWTCEYDPHQIGQVVENMVINAKQAMPQGGTIAVRIENCTIDAGSPTRLDPGPYVRITIRDQGLGIPSEHLSKIFDPFFTTKQTGSGLGLATSWSIIKRHKGHIDVESTPGEGTAFFIYLPASPVNAVSAAPDEQQAAHRGSGRILVMDDEPYIRDVALRMLGALGYTVVTAQDGHEAIDLFVKAATTNDPFKAVLLDLTIPGGMGGKDAAARILAVDSSAILIASSGYADDPVMANPRDSGFTASISKPYRKNDLAALLARIAGSSEIPHPL